MRRVFAACYFGAWFVTTALLCFIVVALVWGAAHGTARTGVDDDVTLLALPAGAALGSWAAARTRRVSALHRVFGILGLAIAGGGTLAARQLLKDSAAASGSGMFAGLGELVGAGMAVVVVSLGAGMFGIWAFARLAKFSDQT